MAKTQVSRRPRTAPVERRAGLREPTLPSSKILEGLTPADFARTTTKTATQTTAMPQRTPTRMWVLLRRWRTRGGERGVGRKQQ